MALGDDGTVWIQLRGELANADIPYLNRRIPYLILDPRGSVLGRVTFSPRTQVAAVLGDKVWAIEQDADNVPSIIRFRVRGLR